MELQKSGLLLYLKVTQYYTIYNKVYPAIFCHLFSDIVVHRHKTEYVTVSWDVGIVLKETKLSSKLAYIEITMPVQQI